MIYILARFLGPPPPVHVQSLELVLYHSSINNPCLCRMTNVALLQKGARVPLCTANNEEHPAANILDGSSSTFWLSTGLFPQEIIISLSQPSLVTSITILCSHVKEILIEKSESDAADLETLLRSELEYQESMQRQEFKLSSPTLMRHIKLIIQSGYDHFVSINCVNVLTS